MKNEIVFYQDNELKSTIEVRGEDDTIWLTQNQIVELFNSSKANISEHIKNIFETGELEYFSTVRKIRTVRIEGGRNVTRELTHYSLDVIISVGYRVNSIRGTQFRIWANKVLKDYLLKGYSLNHRMESVEDDLKKLTQKVKEIDLQIHTDLPPRQGVFFDGQIFDAYSFTCNLVRTAKQSLILIDNYIDDRLLTLFTKRNKNVAFHIFTKNITKQLQLV